MAANMMAGIWEKWKRLNKRQMLLWALGLLHCSLILASYTAALARLFSGEAVLPAAWFRGFLFLFPLAGAEIAARCIPSLWGFTAFSLGNGGFSWLLLGTPWAALPILAVCFFRGKNRLSQEPADSLLDHPHPALVLCFSLPFFYSALGGGAFLQKLTLCTAALYLLTCAAFYGVNRIDAYLRLNRDMAGLPEKRIEAACGLVLLGMLLLAACLVFPSLLGEEGFFQIDPSRRRVSLAPSTAPLTTTPVPSLPAEILQADTGKPLFQVPPFVPHIFFGLLLAAGACGLLYAVYRLAGNFRRSFTEGRDVGQRIEVQEQREKLLGKEGRKLPLWGHSPSAAVRRKYRRAVLWGTKSLPEPWRSPAELEEQAGLQDPFLHKLYEKARYSAEGCTFAESRELRFHRGKSGKRPWHQGEKEEM